MQNHINFRFCQIEDFLEQFPPTLHKQASLLWKAAPLGTTHLEVSSSCQGKGLVRLSAVISHTDPNGVLFSEVFHAGPVTPEVLERGNLLVFLTEKVLYWQNAQ